MLALYAISLLNFSRFLILILSDVEAFSDLFESLLDVFVQLAESALPLQGIFEVIADCHVSRGVFGLGTLWTCGLIGQALKGVSVDRAGGVVALG